MPRLAWFVSVVAVVAASGCGGDDPCAAQPVRCNAEGRREVCADGAWAATDFVCTTNVAVDDQVRSVCATKADGRARCWDRDGLPVGDLTLPDAHYTRMQLAMLGPIGLTSDGRLFSVRGALPDELPPIAEFRATNLWGDQGLCLRTTDGALIFGNHNPELAKTLRVEAGPFVHATCAWEGLVMAVRPDGAVWESPAVLEPHPNDGWVQIALSALLMCGLTPAGAITCHPEITHLGPGLPTFTGGPYRQVAASFVGACALDDRGALTCLRGDGAPLAVDPGPYTFVDAGADLVCGIRVDGTTACFRHDGNFDPGSVDPASKALVPITTPTDADW